MWTTESLWFEIAIVSIIYALGNILMGHFEEQTPKTRRVGKYILTLLIVCCVSFFWENNINDSAFNIYIPFAVCSRLLFTKEKGYKRLDWRTEK